VLHFRVGGAEDVVGMVEGSTVMTIETLPALRPARAPWNKGRIIGQKLPLRVGDWRVIMDDQGNVLAILDIGPRGGVYD